MSQKSKLLVYLESHGSITTAEAMENLRIYRISERIRELEHAGCVIEHLMEPNGSGSKHARYRLISGLGAA